MNAAAERELERLVRDGVMNALENLVRVGTVTWTDPAGRTARVKFQDAGIHSGPLNVTSGGNGDWTPRVGAAVVCLFLPVWNGPGYVLGEIKP